MAIPKPEGGSRYIKLPKPGQSIKVRILSDPVVFWEAWKDRKPVRRKSARDFGPGDYDLVDAQGKAQSPRYSQAFAAYDYTNGIVGILQIKQSTVLTGLYDIDNSPDWGDVREYDVIIKSADDGKSYSVLPCPKKPLADEIVREWDAMCAFGGFDLGQLLIGGDPFNPPAGFSTGV